MGPDHADVPAEDAAGSPRVRSRERLLLDRWTGCRLFDGGLRAEFEIPNPEGAAYGDAYWTKIYEFENAQAAVLDDLLLENPDVENAGVEIEWELLQAKPGQGLVFNEAPLGEGMEAVVRRYEFYAYNTAWGSTHTFTDPDTGEQVPYVDPGNGEVVACVVDGCNDPTADELGDYIGRQIAGFNVPPLGAGAGSVPDGSDVPEDALVIAVEPGGDLTLSWGPSCAAGDTDYEVYEGTLGDFHSHIDRLCSTGGSQTATFSPSPSDSYYLVVSRNDGAEGSYGVASDGSERGQGLAFCLAQQAAGCP